MKDILTLVDFTGTADIAVDESIALAFRHNCSLMLCHISREHSQDVEQELKEKFSPYLEKAQTKGINTSVKIGHGDLNQGVMELVKRYHPFLVVVGTHGKHGIKQNLFGANIYNLVRELPASVLVVNDHTTITDGSFRNILLPVAPHENYLEKVEKACELLDEKGRIELFTIVKPGVHLDESTLRNVEKAEKLMEKKGVTFGYVEIDSRHFSVGYSRETMEYAAQKDFDLICIMSKVSQQNKAFGNMDKETLLLNKYGLPVLCVNH